MRRRHIAWRLQLTYVGEIQIPVSSFLRRPVEKNYLLTLCHFLLLSDARKHTTCSRARFIQHRLHTATAEHLSAAISSGVAGCRAGNRRAFHPARRHIYLTAAGRRSGQPTPAVGPDEPDLKPGSHRHRIGWDGPTIDIYVYISMGPTKVNSASKFWSKRPDTGRSLHFLSRANSKNPAVSTRVSNFVDLCWLILFCPVAV